MILVNWWETLQEICGGREPCYGEEKARTSVGQRGRNVYAAAVLSSAANRFLAV